MLSRCMPIEAVILRKILQRLLLNNIERLKLVKIRVERVYGCLSRRFNGSKPKQAILDHGSAKAAAELAAVKLRSGLAIVKDSEFKIVARIRFW